MTTTFTEAKLALESKESALFFFKTIGTDPFDCGSSIGGAHRHKQAGTARQFLIYAESKQLTPKRVTSRLQSANDAGWRKAA